MDILLLSPIDAGAIARLSEDHRVLKAFGPDAGRMDEMLATVNVVILRSGTKLDADMVATAPQLRLVIRAGSGADNIALDALTARGIPLLRIPEPGARAVAEMAFALMLAMARNLLVADELWREGRWAKHELTGTGLAGKVLGVYGAGNIGMRVGFLGAAWGMEVIGCVEHATDLKRRDLAESNMRLASPDEVLDRSDFLSLHVPLTRRTRGLIGSSELARMKRGSFLVNLARGGVVDELALLDALESGHLAGAALDVHLHEGDGAISPLAGLRNVVLTPHIGAATVDAQREIGERVVEAVEALAQSAPVSNGHHSERIAV